MEAEIQAGLLSIGDELLIGQITDTNQTYLSQNLTELGISVTKRIAVGDNTSHIVQAFHELSHCDLVIVSGGLGTTDDDLTREAVADLIGSTVETSDSAEEILRNRCAVEQREYTPTYARMARLPCGTALLRNSVGHAPGFHFRYNNMHVFCVPGVPREMKAMFLEEIVPLLNEYRSETAMEVVMVSGISECEIQQRLDDTFSREADCVVGTKVQPGACMIRVLANGPDAAAKAVAKQQDIVRLLQPFVWSTDVNIIQPELEFVRFVGSQGLTVSVAESCTGGMLGSALTSVDGASAVFVGGILAYATRVKTDVLSVPVSCIAKHSPVSQQTAAHMARNVASLFNTNIGLSITGEAGLHPATDNPPGTVWLGVHLNIEDQQRTFCFLLRLRVGRTATRIRAVADALVITLQLLHNIPFSQVQNFHIADSVDMTNKF